MASFNPLNATLDRIFAILIQIIIRRDLIKRRILVDDFDLEERKVLEYLAHVGWDDHGISRYERVRREHGHAFCYRQWLENVKTKQKKIGNQVFQDESYVPFQFFRPTLTSSAGPYGKNWSIQAIKASPLSELHWNKPFESSLTYDSFKLTEPLPENLIVHVRAFAHSGGINRFFSRTPSDSFVRRDFTVRFLYEEDDYVCMNGEKWPILIYHTVFRRDIDFALDRIQYQVHLSSCHDPRNEPEPLRYVFGWERNLIESKIHHRFYRHYLDEEKGEWVVKERGSGKSVRGRRGIVETKVFEMWMGRDEEIHPAWRKTKKEFEREVAAWTDDEWVIDYQERIASAYRYWPSWVEGAGE
ncbi:hypothetical protein EV361DRAFT_943257 [Lentinula raphanica]|uniref:Uncharacterized protein n=1 Tax=Lentinula raphanica TaxID=153919 RepID=A0AA38U6I7_9AGAR|nr:hypothetical protein F5878DRAFT_666500 [Lentinula raphanica]KAJ3963825.1 hypothetical protein EV361DRAFT_943257 [Lentinula raphanica]